MGRLEGYPEDVQYLRLARLNKDALTVQTPRAAGIVQRCSDAAGTERKPP
jgi:hypothetical protein